MAEVMNPTSCCQLGNGRNAISPMTKARTARPAARRCRVVRSRTFGALPLRAIAKEIRDVIVV